MEKQILSASVFLREDTPALQITPVPGVNLLWGQNAEAVLLTLAGIFGGYPPQNAKVEILWHWDARIIVGAADGACVVHRVRTQYDEPVLLEKAFHKKRFLRCRKTGHLFNGTELPAGFAGAGELLLEKFQSFLAAEGDTPLFICNFLERLDRSVDLQPLLAALLSTGRQVFIAVPQYYPLVCRDPIHICPI